MKAFVAQLARSASAHRGFCMFVSLSMFAFIAINVVLSPNHSFRINGQVVDDAGKPMPGVNVHVVRTYDSSVIHLPLPFASSARQDRRIVITDANGRFDVSGRGISVLISPEAAQWQVPPATADMPYRFVTEKHGVNRTVVYRMRRTP